VPRCLLVLPPLRANRPPGRPGIRAITHYAVSRQSVQESSPEWVQGVRDARWGGRHVGIAERRGIWPKSPAELNLWALQNMPVHDLFNKQITGLNRHVL
jgi:hypothetical protein